jgi:DNA-directed RNA polymerase subunit E'/Rpb7
MELDFKDRVKIDPDELNETVRSSVENALLRMTERKMLADK